MFEAAPLAVAPAPLSERPAPLQGELEAIVPQQPGSLLDTGLERPLVLSLLAKTIARLGKAHLPVLGGKLRLSMSVLREALALMLEAQLVEVARRGDSDIDIEYQLTGPGQAFAAAALAQCSYVGPAPVTLEAFRAAILRDAQRHAANPPIGEADLLALGDGPADDLIDANVRAQLGAALHSGRAMLLHGAPGSGKTVLANKLGRLLQGVVAVPYALLIDHRIVRFHDATIHRAPPPPQARQFDERRNDMRWMICQRPVVHVGAELSREMLECRLDSGTGTYYAPAHLQASGGLLIIDDLGRQRCAASEVLNRLLRPLEHGCDTLHLQGGHSESMPFALTAVFVTSCVPGSLMDAALLRRIAYKISLGPLPVASYLALLRRQCNLLQVAYDDAAASHLVQRLHLLSGQPMLASVPGELASRIADAAAFARVAPRLSVASIEQAWQSLFACCPPTSPASAVTDHVLLGVKA